MSRSSVVGLASLAVLVGLVVDWGAARSRRSRPTALKPPVVIVSQPVRITSPTTRTSPAGPTRSSPSRSGPGSPGSSTRSTSRTATRSRRATRSSRSTTAPTRRTSTGPRRRWRRPRRTSKRLDADYQRVANLYSRGNASREEFDKATGDRSEAEAAVGVAQADYDLAKLNMTFTKITAPISGLLSRRLVDPGNLVQADTTPLTTIVSLDPLYVYFDVDERTLLRLRRLVREKKIPSRQEPEIPVLVGALRRGRRSRTRGSSTSRQPGRPGHGHPAGPGVDRQPQAAACSRRACSCGSGCRSASRGKSIMIAEKAIGTDQGQKYVYMVNDKNEVDQAARERRQARRRDASRSSRGSTQGERVVDRGAPARPARPEGRPQDRGRS